MVLLNIGCTKLRFHINERELCNAVWNKRFFHRTLYNTWFAINYCLQSIVLIVNNSHSQAIPKSHEQYSQYFFGIIISLQQPLKFRLSINSMSQYHDLGPGYERNLIILMQVCCLLFTRIFFKLTSLLYTGQITL